MDTPTYISPRPGIINMWDHHVEPFYMGSGDQPQVLILIWQMLHWLNHLASPTCTFKTGEQEVFWTVASPTLSKHHPHLLRDSFPGVILRSRLLDISRCVKFHASQIGAVDGKPGPQNEALQIYQEAVSTGDSEHATTQTMTNQMATVSLGVSCDSFLYVLSVWAVWIVWRCCRTGGDGLSGSTLRLKEKHPGEQQSWGLGGEGAAELNLPLWQSWL